MRHVNASADLIAVFVITNNVEMMINAGVYAKNLLINVYVIKDKEFIDKCVCDKGLIWNPSNCECECDKACVIGEYLDYENCKCRKELVDKLVDECTETVEEVKIAKITLAEKESSYKCSSCTVYFLLFWIFFTINFGGISAYFVYFHGYLKKMFTCERIIC